MIDKKDAKHTAAGIPTWSPTVVLICRSTAYVWQSGRDAQFSADCGRMCLMLEICESHSYHAISLHVDEARQRQTLSALGRSRHPTPPQLHQHQPSSFEHALINQLSVHSHQPRLKVIVGGERFCDWLDAHLVDITRMDGIQLSLRTCSIIC
jgi:hypothetical protein